MLSKLGLKAKINLAILIIMLVISSIFLIGNTGFTIISGMRAYVGAEGLWAKGQQSATYYLTQYIYTSDPTLYTAFQTSLEVTLGDKQARLALEKKEIDDQAAFDGFLKGGNHSDDIAIMIFLYKHFKDVSYIKKSIEQWQIGDALIEELLNYGYNVHQRIINNNLNKDGHITSLRVVDDLQTQLSLAEKTFSFHMAEASRWVAEVFCYVMLISVLLGALICYLMMRVLARVVSELNESENRYRRITDNAQDVIFRIAIPSGEFEYISPASLSLFGYIPETLYKQRDIFPKIVHPDWREFFTEQWRHICKGEVPELYEYQILNKQGKARWVSQRNVLVHDKFNNAIAIEGIVSDITPKKEWEIEKTKLELDLRQSHKMEAIGTLAGGIAHDFNNLLTVILGYAELLQERFTRDDKNRKNIDVILIAGGRARDLVKQILAYSRKESGERSATNIEILLNETMKLLRSSIPKTIAFECEIDNACGNIYADSTQIQQVIINLCTNAYQAMPEKGGVIKVNLSSVQLSGYELNTLYSQNAKPGKYIKLTVTDSGMGIANEHLDRIFDPYFTNKAVGEGSGMGLAVVIGIVKSHDGMITVNSSPGNGASFNVYFPELSSELSLEHKSETQYVAPQGTEHILVVDDEKHIVEITKRRLESLGYRVSACIDSREALDLFKQQAESFDLIITDQTMPGMTGEKLAREISLINNKIPIIMCSGYSYRSNTLETEANNIKTLLMKPVEKEELAEIVAKILQSAKSTTP